MSEISLKPSDRSMIIGVPDMGKSVLFRYLVKQYLDAGNKVLLYDSEKQHGSLQSPNLKVYTPQTPADIEEFDKVCGEVWERRRMILAIESIDFYAKPQQPLSPNMMQVIHWGRGRGIGVLMTSRRIAGVHKDCCGLCRHWFLFHTYLPNDVKYIRQFIGKTADDLKKLPPHYFIHWSGGKAEICNPITPE